MKKPAFLRFLIQELTERHGKAPRFTQSDRSYFLTAGERIFKIPKREPRPDSQTAETLIAQRNIERLSAYSPGLNGRLWVLSGWEGAFVLTEGLGEAETLCRFVYEMDHISAGFAFIKLLKKKQNETLLRRLVTHLNAFHAGAGVNGDKTQGTADHLLEALDDIFFQSNKHLNRTFSSSIAIIAEPALRKFVEQHKKLLNRRVRLGKNRLIHGGLTPNKIYEKDGTVLILPRVTRNLNESADVYSDLADLTSELKMLGLESEAHRLTSEYLEQNDEWRAPNRRLTLFYETLKYLGQGLFYSFLSSDVSDRQEHHTETATRYYQQAKQTALELQ